MTVTSPCGWLGATSSAAPLLDKPNWLARAVTAAMKSLRATRETLHETQDIVLEQGRRAARLTDDYVHDNPWQAVAAAGLAGLLLGLVLSGRR